VYYRNIRRRLLVSWAIPGRELNEPAGVTGFDALRARRAEELMDVLRARDMAPSLEECLVLTANADLAPFSPDISDYFNAARSRTGWTGLRRSASTP
jgi:hypothetical protein